MFTYSYRIEPKEQLIYCPHWTQRTADLLPALNPKNSWFTARIEPKEQLIYCLHWTQRTADLLPALNPKISWFTAQNILTALNPKNSWFTAQNIRLNNHSWVFLHPPVYCFNAQNNIWSTRKQKPYVTFNQCCLIKTYASHIIILGCKQIDTGKPQT